MRAYAKGRKFIEQFENIWHFVHLPFLVCWLVLKIAVFEMQQVTLPKRSQFENFTVWLHSDFHKFAPTTMHMLIPMHTTNFTAALSVET